jgi:hypothetical protein
MSNFINNLVNGNLEDFRKDIFDTLYSKTGEVLENRKKEIAMNLYSQNEAEEQEHQEEE